LQKAKNYQVNKYFKLLIEAFDNNSLLSDVKHKIPCIFKLRSDIPQFVMFKPHSSGFQTLFAMEML